MAATRDTNSDTSKTGPGPSRQSKMQPCPEYFYAPEPIPSRNTAGNKKDRPAG